MHVAIRKADESYRHPRAADLQDIGVVGRGTSDSRKLERQPVILARLDQPFRDNWVHVGPSENDWPLTDTDVPLLPLIDGWAVGRVRHVNGDAHVGIDTEGGGRGSAQSDLFLNSGDGVQRNVQAFQLG